MIEEKKVITNKNLSVYQGVVNCWSGEKLSKWKDRFIIRASKFEFPVHRPYHELTDEENVASASAYIEAPTNLPSCPALPCNGD